MKRLLNAIGEIKYFCLLESLYQKGKLDGHFGKYAKFYKAWYWVWNKYG